MRRITLWLLSTITLLVLLFSYRTSTVGLHPAGAAPVVATPAAGSSSKSTVVPTPTPTATPGAAPEDGASSAAPSAAAKTATPSATAAPTVAAPQTVAGTVADTRWGPIQVSLTVTAGKVVAVNVPVYPDGNFRDQEINARALPVLIQETLDAQSAKIDAVSGATVTSDGYVQSLQAALDAAHLA